MIPQLHIQEVQDDDAMLSLWLRNPTHIASMWCSSSAWPYGSERHSDWWCVRWWNIGIYTKDKSTHFMVKWCDMHRDSMIFHRLSWIIDDNPWNTHSIYTSHHSWMFFFSGSSWRFFPSSYWGSHIGAVPGLWSQFLHVPGGHRNFCAAPGHLAKLQQVIWIYHYIYMHTGMYTLYI